MIANLEVLMPESLKHRRKAWPAVRVSFFLYTPGHTGAIERERHETMKGAGRSTASCGHFCQDFAHDGDLVCHSRGVAEYYKSVPTDRALIDDERETGVLWAVILQVDTLGGAVRVRRQMS